MLRMGIGLLHSDCSSSHELPPNIEDSSAMLRMGIGFLHSDCSGVLLWMI